MVQVTNFLLKWLYLNSLSNGEVALPEPEDSQEGYHNNDGGWGRAMDSATTWRPASSWAAGVTDTGVLGLQESRNTHSSSLPVAQRVQSHLEHDVRRHHGEWETTHHEPLLVLLESTAAGESSSQMRWKDDCRRLLASFPEGTPRSLALDSYRLGLVYELERALDRADKVLQRSSKWSLRDSANGSTRVADEDQQENAEEDEEEEDDPFIQTDLKILNDEVQRESNGYCNDTLLGAVQTDSPSRNNDTHDDARKAMFVISAGSHDEDGGESTMIETPMEEEDETIEGNGDRLARVFQKAKKKHPPPPPPPKPPIPPPTDEEVAQARLLIQESYDYLPQLVSAILRSSPRQDCTPPHLDPLLALRDLLVKRCVSRPDWGVALCWLLEAEVGRAWKTLFEHRQRTGRRLVVVLPAEKAAVLAKIGSSKRTTFELLQDAEQSTAFGVFVPPPTPMGMGHEPPHLKASHRSQQQRCSHYGDTMHFVDRLTNLSLDLRRAPTNQRTTMLHENLEEMNRRLRRRMVTRGVVSLDIEDHLGPYDGPRLEDLNIDMLQYSVHLPLEPKAKGWPGSASAKPQKTGVVRILNIVTPECRILSSRERCPYLLHVEVAETGLEGNDPHLYSHLDVPVGGFYSSPPAEGGLLTSSPHDAHAGGEMYSIPGNGNGAFRGGSQYGEGYYYPPANSGEQEASHEQIQQQQSQSNDFSQNTQYGVPDRGVLSGDSSVSTSSALLNKIYGIPWKQKCEQVRQKSFFGGVEGWRLASFILKAGEDIRREAMVMQVISKLNGWFQEDIPEEMRPFLRPYTIMCAGGDAGLVECISDAKSVDEVKKRADGYTTLRQYFERAYGPPSRAARSGWAGSAPRATRGGSIVPPPPYQAASRFHMKNQQRQLLPSFPESTIGFDEVQDNFLRSLVGYSLVCYILQVKDRHNANILLDREGHLMHIDFGYVLGDTPKMSKVPIFAERAPFKLTAEFWDVIGGWNVEDGGLGVRFCEMFEVAFACASAHSDEIVTLIEAAVLSLTRNTANAKAMADGIRDRLRMRGAPKSKEQKKFIMDLVDDALNSWGTSTYDWLQKNMNGYQP